jgi:hypothetical protein
MVMIYASRVSDAFAEGIQRLGLALSGAAALTLNSGLQVRWLFLEGVAFILRIYTKLPSCQGLAYDFLYGIR